LTLQLPGPFKQVDFTVTVARAI